MDRISTNFGFSSTADEVVAGIDLTGKTAIVTGAASGIGIETARSLARAGATVTLAVRDINAASKVAKDITATTGNKNIRIAKLDLTNRVSISSFVEEWNGPLNILINNAGIMALPELQRSFSGYELQFATNHLGHFLLTLELHEALAEAGAARVVIVSSSAHLLSPIVFDDIHFNFRKYDPWLAYAQSKTANILFAVGITNQWAIDGITANALNPGAIATNLQRHIGGTLSSPLERQKNVLQGAATSVLLAASPLLNEHGGRYFEDCNEAIIVLQRPENYEGVANYALDAANAERLWDASVKMIG